jgi:predicted transcriptional regulator
MATSVKLDDDMKDRIQHLAETKDRSAHWIMKEAIGEYVTREEKRANFRQEAVDSWKEYQETGLHVAGQEMHDWLVTWGTDKDTGPPECHT